MTTIKEYKAMIEGATDALSARPAFMIGGLPVMGEGVIEKINQINNSSRKLAPELIRVIELAEEALNSVVDDYDYKGHGAVLVNALSEIRKLKGE